jgi:hypothetical protein
VEERKARISATAVNSASHMQCSASTLAWCRWGGNRTEKLTTAIAVPACKTILIETTDSLEAFVALLYMQEFAVEKKSQSRFEQSGGIDVSSKKLKVAGDMRH